MRWIRHAYTCSVKPALGFETELESQLSTVYLIGQHHVVSTLNKRAYILLIDNSSTHSTIKTGWESTHTQTHTLWEPKQASSAEQICFEKTNIQMAINAYLVTSWTDPWALRLCMCMCVRDVQHVHVSVGKNAGVTKSGACITAVRLCKRV